MAVLVSEGRGQVATSGQSCAHGKEQGPRPGWGDGAGYITAGGCDGIKRAVSGLSCDRRLWRCDGCGTYWAGLGSAPVPVLGSTQPQSSGTWGRSAASAS